MFEADKVNRESFANLFSYKAALWIGEKCNELLSLKSEGYIFFYENSPIELAFRFDYDTISPEFGLVVDEYCVELWVGDQHSEVDGEWKVWCTKKDLTEILKRFTVVHPKNFIKII